MIILLATSTSSLCLRADALLIAELNAAAAEKAALEADKAALEETVKQQQVCEVVGASACVRGCIWQEHLRESCSCNACCFFFTLLQEDFEMVRSALENRMANLCASITQQENIIQELQAEETRAKEANNTLNVRAWSVCVCVLSCMYYHVM